MEPSASPLSGIVAGHIAIGERIAMGGMGEVYRAEDRRLGRTVAVKAMLPELSADENARRRFVRESRVACQVIHPYVATVFDILEHDERVLIVMEYIEGRPLGDVLRDERPPSATVLRWLLEVAEGVLAIHRAGLVHRDIKPGNVLVSRDGHVKVTDFGLARRALPLDPAPDSSTATLDTPITRDGSLLGTPMYMSPEQLRGETIDARSDQFSFGVLAYQALTGAHPFARRSALESVSAILKDPPSGGDATPVLRRSDSLRRTLDVLLAKERDERYRDSEAMLHELRRAASSFGDAAPTPRSWLLATGLGTALLVLVVAAGGWWWVRRAPAWDGPRFSLAIAPFEDLTGVDGGSVQASMVADLLATDLQSSHLVRAEGPQELQLAAGATGTLELVSTRRVDYVLAGKLYREAGDYVATVTIEAVGEDSSPLPGLRVSGATALAVAEQLASRLRRVLPQVSRLDALRDDRVDLVEITSGSAAARLAYETGMVAMREDRLVDAVAAFEQAAAADPAFAMAFARLAESLDREGYGRRAREAAAQAQALSPGRDSRARVRLALTIDAIRARVFSRSDEWVRASEELSGLYPDEPLLLERLARALRAAGRTVEAVERIDRAVLLDPLNPTLRLTRGQLLHRAGRLDDADASLDDATVLFELAASEEGLAAVESARGAILQTQERQREAAERFTRAAELYTDAGRELSAAAAWLDVAGTLLEIGETDAADERIAVAVALAEELGNLRMLCEALSARGVLYQHRGDYPRAVDYYREAIDRARQLESASLLSDPLTNAAALLAWLGRVDEARPLLDETIRVARELGREDMLQSGLFSAAEMALHAGELDAAVGHYEELLAAQGERPERLPSFAHLGLAGIHRQRGELGAALDQLDRAIETFDALDLPQELARALVARARVQSGLGRRDAAAADLSEADRVGAEYPEIVRASARIRAVQALDREAWGEALAGVAAQPDAGESRILLLVACRAHLGRGDLAKAEKSCRALIDAPRASAIDRTTARTLLAGILFAAGRKEEAERIAHEALEEAERMRLRPQIAGSSAVGVGIALANGVDGPDVESMRRRGRAALSEMLAAVPAADRARFERHPDVSNWIEVLGIKRDPVGSGQTIGNE